jgi:hypothetical protein
MPRYVQIISLLKGIRRHCDGQGHSIEMGPLEAGNQGPSNYWFTCADCGKIFEISIPDAHDPRRNKHPVEARLTKMLETPQGRRHLIRVTMTAAITESLYTCRRDTRDYHQKIITEWIQRTFGEASLSENERALRFLEESLELVQAAGLPIEKARELLEYVYSRPSGVVAQGVGGVGISLLAFCEKFGISAEEEEALEVERVITLEPEYFRKRQDAKAKTGVGLPSEVPPEGA